MKRYILLGCFLILAIHSVQAQNEDDLYIPRDVKEAYENGTRTKNGSPGKNYWENHGTYDISLHLNPTDRIIYGSEEITYHNNSPDTLKSLVFRLFMNSHKPGAARQYAKTDKYMTSGVHIDSYAENGKKQKWDSKNDGTWRRKKLSDELAPDDSIHLSIKWHYKLTLKPGREGQIDSTTYYLAYFYPRVSVYDDYHGWDTIDFTGYQEFYSDFNDYRVNITVPENFVVWGTGILKNAENVLQKKALSRFQKSLKSDKTIHVANYNEMLNGRVTAENKTNTWTFQSHNIPDVAFGLSDHFIWDAASVVVDDKTDRRAGVQAAYNDTSADFRHMVHYGQHALEWFSHNWPGVPYPYAKTTVFQGGAGMEYPMMVNDAAYADSVFSRFVAEHEIAHTYFPFYMGINESRYAFMDEGWATTLELLIGRVDQGKQNAEDLFRTFRVKRWINDPSTIGDLPIITPADMLKGAAYGNNAYGKAALGYLAMKDLLGDQLFKKCLHAYMHRWHGKHPTPWDFFYTFNDVSGRNLNWFWRSWYFQNNYIDIGLENIAHTGEGYTVTLKNIGGMPAPVNLKITYRNGKSEVLHKSPEIWSKNQRQATIKLQRSKEVRAIDIEGGIWMDADTTNNSWKK